jgi:hypothetical protein
MLWRSRKYTSDRSALISLCYSKKIALPDQKRKRRRGPTRRVRAPSRRRRHRQPSNAAPPPCAPAIRWISSRRPPQASLATVVLRFPPHLRDPIRGPPPTRDVVFRDRVCWSSAAPHRRGRICQPRQRDRSRRAPPSSPTGHGIGHHFHKMS